MVIRHFANILLSACFTWFAPQAHAFFDPPWITPENPVEGDAIYVNIHGGICDGILQEAGYPQFTREGNAIRARWYGQHWPEGSGDLLCSFNIFTMTSPIGAFEAGDYTLTVELAYYDFSGIPSILTIGVVPFTVAAAPMPSATSVPALGALDMLVLFVLMLGLAAWKLRAGAGVWLVLVLASIPLGARAQDGTIRVLMSSAPGAPSPDAVVSWCRGPIPTHAQPCLRWPRSTSRARSWVIT